MVVAAIPNNTEIDQILFRGAEVGEKTLVKLYFVTTVSDNLIGSAAGFPDSCDDRMFVNLEDDPDILPCFRQHGGEVPIEISDLPLATIGTGNVVPEAVGCEYLTTAAWPEMAEASRTANNKVALRIFDSPRGRERAGYAKC